MQDLVVAAVEGSKLLQLLVAVDSLPWSCHPVINLSDSPISL